MVILGSNRQTLNTKKTTTSDIWNPGSGLGQAQKCHIMWRG